MSLAESCWLKVMTERQRTLEENYKMEISASHKADKGPARMRDVSPLWEEMANKTWLLYSGQPAQLLIEPPKKWMVQKKIGQKKKYNKIFLCFLRVSEEEGSQRLSGYAGFDQQRRSLSSGEARERDGHGQGDYTPTHPVEVKLSQQISKIFQIQLRVSIPPEMLAIWLCDSHRISPQCLNEVYLLSNVTSLQEFRIVSDLLEEVEGFEMSAF